MSKDEKSNMIHYRSLNINKTDQNTVFQDISTQNVEQILKIGQIRTFSR